MEKRGRDSHPKESDVTKHTLAKIPVATYRIQCNRSFPFREAQEVIPYWAALGISHCYTSPLTRARRGSLHGYDVVRYDELNPEIGSEEEMASFVKILHRFHMSLLVDIVPNHMCVSSGENLWWYDVLEKGEVSPYAAFFDIEWDATYRLTRKKVLIPVLGKILHQAIEEGDIDIVYDKGIFFVTYYDRWFPLHRESWKNILEPTFAILGDKIQGIEIPMTSEALDRLHRESRDFRHVLEQVLERMNGMPGEVESFEEMKALLRKQHYRLSYWRMGHERINYRRFFDIYELASLQQQNEQVFIATHRWILEKIKEGWVEGLRIDHVDGIADPQGYLERLARACADVSPHLASFYLIVEKILSENEALVIDWPVFGTTGYEFLNILNQLFVEERNHEAFNELYRNFSGQNQGAQEVAYRSKEIVLHTLFISERKSLVRLLGRALSDYKQEVFSVDILDDVLREVLALFPVYRTYVRSDQRYVSEYDHVLLREVIQKAKALNENLPSKAFALCEHLLTLTLPEGEGTLSSFHKEFVTRFQQLTGPVMAKGIEDTAFYRRYPLASLNEVGSELGGFGLSISSFHEKMEMRKERWPYSLSTTYTHDTKRSEDARCRLHVLSEIPQEWEAAIWRWHQFNKGKQKEEKAPDWNEEYLIYQSLIATWPFDSMDDYEREEYTLRIDHYLKKAMKEAKVHTSWVDPHDTHEKDVHLFVHSILDPNASKRFLADFSRFIAPIQRFGMWTSLSQLVLKCTAPGVPDFYQGSEIWDFRLVDPDNRHPVYYARRKEWLKEVEEADSIEPFLHDMRDGKIKMFCMRILLHLRKEDPLLFTKGSYIPIPAIGEKGECLIAFARKSKKKTVIIITSRFFTKCFREGVLDYGDTHLLWPRQLDAPTYADRLTKEQRTIVFDEERKVLVSTLLTKIPFAVLYQTR